MEKRYVKVPFTEIEKNTLQEAAKAHGMRMNAYIKQCVLVQRHFEFVNDAERFERHTHAINRCREAINGLYHAELEDKILISDTIRKLHETHYNIECEEAKLRKEVRMIRKILHGDSIENDLIQEGDETGDFQVQPGV